MTTRNRRRVLELIHDICEQYETNLKQGIEVEIGEWIDLVGESNRAELFFELLRLETHYISDHSGNRIGDWFRKYPEFSNEIVKVFSTNRRLGEDESLIASNSYLEQIESGDHIGRFEVVSLLGAGGFAVVYLAHDPESGQAVALKVLNAEDESDRQQCIECLINEANVLSQIDHPLIPKVHDIGEDQLGNPWVAMEFIKGTSLYELLTTEQLSFAETLRILVKTARALSEVHRAGFTHRDIKPDNIIIGLDGEPRICDYGLALHEDVQRDRSGERAGTTCYMSPEQVMGRSENLDGRTDIWSLGVILYLIVAKRLPFHGNNKQEVREAILHQPVKPPRQIKSNVATIQLENVCLNALRKSPQERYPTADDFADAVQDAIDSLPIEHFIEEASITRQINDGEQRSMRLAKHARKWNLSPSVENLPGPYRYVEFLTRTDRSIWTESESQLMSACLRHYRRLGALLAIVVAMIVFAQFRTGLVREDERVRNVIKEISLCPINKVEATYKRLSSFAPEKCLAGVERALESIGDGESDEKLRLAMLSQRKDEHRGLFLEHLVHARFEDIPTLRKLLLDDSIDHSNLTLDDDTINMLTRELETTVLVPGMERIWPNAPLAFADAFEAFGGELKPEYAWCGTMPLETFQQTCEEMREFRYRPVCVRPWFDDRFDDRERQNYVSAVWHRSSVDWRISYGITTEQFLAEKAGGSMNLVDVSDGLQPVDGKTQLIAVWSDHPDPYGKARQMLLADRIPALAENLDDDESDNYGIISHDIDSRYLLDTPTLVDVSIHLDVLYKPRASREHQKIHVGQMISRSCQTESESEAVKSSRLPQGLETAKELVGEAWFALGDYERSSDQFQNLNFDGTWQDLLLRTRSLAVAGEAASAAYCKSVLMKKMRSSILNRTRPFIMLSEARAITNSLQAELEFWVDRDADHFIKWAEHRLNKVERSRKNSRYSLATEYYSMACAAHSINQSVSTMPGAKAKEQSAKLKILAESLAQKSIKNMPSIRKSLVKLRAMHSVPGWPFSDSKLYEEMPVRSSAWTAHAENFESRFIKPRTDQHHKTTCRLLGEGFHPVSIVQGKRGGGEPRLGSIWHREIASEELVRREQKIANALCLALLHNEDIGIWKILSSPKNSPLKQRIVETIPQFGIELTKLLERLESSNNEFERVSILETLRGISIETTRSEEAAKILRALGRVESIGSEPERRLCRIIRLNIDPPKLSKSTDTSTSGSAR